MSGEPTLEASLYRASLILSATAIVVGLVTFTVVVRRG